MARYKRVDPEVMDTPGCEYDRIDPFGGERSPCAKQAVTIWVSPDGLSETYRCRQHDSTAASRWAEMNGWKRKEVGADKPVVREKA